MRRAILTLSSLWPFSLASHKTGVSIEEASGQSEESSAVTNCRTLFSANRKVGVVSI